MFLGARHFAAAAIFVTLLGFSAGRAHAAGWTVTTTYSGSKTYRNSSGQTVTEAWAANGANINLGDESRSSSGPGHYTDTATTSGTVTINYTWNGTNGTSTPDPAPGEVYITETGSALWNGKIATATAPPPYTATASFSGQVSCGVAGATTSPVGVGQDGTSQSNTKNGIPYVKVTGAISRTYTIKAEVTCTWPTYVSGVAYLRCTLSNGIGIHPHAYNFRLRTPTTANPNPVIDNVNGVLGFTYDWNSTNGDLNGIHPDSRVYEHLKFSDYGTPAGREITWQGRLVYMPPAPSFPEYHLPQPSDPFLDVRDRNGHIYYPASAGTFPDYHSRFSSFTTDAAGKFIRCGYKATQNYRFVCEDPACPDFHKPEDNIKGPEGKTHVITRAVRPTNPAATTAKYHVNKDIPEYSAYFIIR